MTRDYLTLWKQPIRRQEDLVIVFEIILLLQGLLMVVSAGNSGADACNQSPAASDFA